MKKLYVVEDDEDIRSIVEYILYEDGYLIRTFPDAKSFVNAFKSPFPDLVLMDVRLPDGDGRELCKMVKNKKNTSCIPVLLMSAYSGLDEIAKNSDADGFINKPFDVGYLREVVKKHFNN